MEDVNKADNAFKMVIQLSSSTSWEDIPDELWEKIFCTLHHNCNKRLLDSVSLVCKRFLSLSNKFVTSIFLSPSKSGQPPYSRFLLINTIKLSSADPNLDATITQLAHSNLRLQSLLLYEQTRFPKEAMRLLGQCMGRTLTSLSCVRFNKLYDADVDVVADYFPYLQKLDIDSDNGGLVTDEGILAISKKLKFLLSLKVTNHRHLSQRSFESLSSNCLLLSELTAGGGIEFDIRLDQFISFSTLSSLNLQCVLISETMLCKLSEAKLKLRILFLRSPLYSSDMKGTTVCRFFKSLVSLNYLFLERFYFTADITARDFALSIPNMEELILHDSDFPRRATESTLFQILKNCRLLKGMSICYTSLRPHLDWLNAPFRCQLVKLVLYDCRDLDDQIIESISNICPSLETLKIDSSSKLTSRGIEAVKVRCNNLKCLNICGSFERDEYLL